MKIKVWLDSGANAFSKYERTIDLEEELGISEQEWNSMSYEDQEEVMQPIVWENADWGWNEL